MKNEKIGKRMEREYFSIETKENEQEREQYTNKRK